MTMTSTPVEANTSITIDGKEIEYFFDLRIEQSFNDHHRFSFYVPSDKINYDGGVSFIKKDTINYIGKEIIIKWGVNKGTANTFNGLITDTSVHAQYNAAVNLHITGYSSSYVLSNLPKTRSFFDKDPKNPEQTLKKVVNSVVQGAMGPYCGLSCNIANNIELPYVVQYKESTFDFLNRLAVRYGEWLYVDGKTLHFGKPKGEPKFHELLLGRDLLNLNYEFNMKPVRRNVTGYNHQAGKTFEPSGANPAGDLGDVFGTLNDRQQNIFNSDKINEHLSWQPNSLNEVKEQGAYRGGEQLAHSFTLSGESCNPDVKLGDGLKFKIMDPSKNNAEQSFRECRVIAITHYMQRSADGAILYTNEFRAIDAKAKYIPVNTLNPYNAQPEYAKVVSTEDASGRVQVSFFWNKDNELNKSFFMPCLSSYAGGETEPKNRGILFIPEEGDMVLVGYYQNDPNHPYVMGGLHNSKTASIKEDNKKNDIKSITTRTGHVIEFNDKKDAESITITDKNKNVILMNKDGVKVTANEAKNTILMTKDGIKMTDDTNTNSVEMGKDGIVLKAEKDVKIMAQNITMEAKTTIEQKVSASSVKIESASIEQKTGSSSVKLAAASIEQKSGSGSVEVGASGVDIKGPMVKIS